MAKKVLFILLCVASVSMLSGCYCYPPGYYPAYRPYHHRYY
jgi:hypothetical protein